MSSREAHINNLYNTVFWALIQHGGVTATQAHKTLQVRVCKRTSAEDALPLISVARQTLTPRIQGTNSGQKNEILFSRFNINYNTLSARFRKGSILVREEVCVPILWSRPSEMNVSIPLSKQRHELEDDATPDTLDVEASAGAECTREVVQVLHCDIIRDEFWIKRPHLLVG